MKITINLPKLSDHQADVMETAILVDDMVSLEETLVEILADGSTISEAAIIQED